MGLQFDFCFTQNICKGFPESPVGKESACDARRLQLDSWVRKVLWRGERLATPAFLGFPFGSAGRESACSAGDLGSIPGLGRSPGERKGYPTPVFWPGESQRVGHNRVTFSFTFHFPWPNPFQMCYIDFFWYCTFFFSDSQLVPLN